jgi:hypothetical protein
MFESLYEIMTFIYNKIYNQTKEELIREEDIKPLFNDILL